MRAKNKGKLRVMRRSRPIRERRNICIYLYSNCLIELLNLNKKKSQNSLLGREVFSA